MGEVEEPALSEVEWDLLLCHPGTGIPVEKRIPPLRCAPVGMTTPFGQADLEDRIWRYIQGRVIQLLINIRSSLESVIPTGARSAQWRNLLFSGTARIR
jgi:hypothetical protein